MIETRDTREPVRSRSRALRWLGVWSALVFVAWAAVPFALAGDARWPRGWLHLGILAVGLGAHRVHVRRKNPALARRRRQGGEGTPRWDLVWNALFWPLLASVACVAGLEARSHAPLPPAVAAAGVLLFGAGLSLSAAAMAVNPFFEGTVRIQRDAGQRPVEAGPYRRIRHPGYAGLGLWALATPLLLGSSWSFLPATATVAWVFVRTALEDRLLRRELPGYAGYAGRVRWRLVPGVW